MRLSREKVNIDYKETNRFFGERAKKYKEDNPYSVTMYQDNNPELVRMRNGKEIERLLPKLELDECSRVLDIACGIGRWADVITQEISGYVGIDFSKELIEIAKSRNRKGNFSFYQGTASEISNILSVHHIEGINKILMIGILMYLNDKEVTDLFKQVSRIASKNVTVCIREPVAIKDRLTLKEFYSTELQDSYSAIYRTREELNEFMEENLFREGFQIRQEGFLFEEDALNNRKETAQYYYLLERHNKEQSETHRGEGKDEQIHISI